ncbi:MAG TPA: M23 family metallopeptidase [Woeseiaceae bacterium]|nr:M23 family metallopeptidase [Woeseiaceae bacterium]
MGGGASTSDERRTISAGVVALALIVATAAPAASLYKYRGPGGEWIYADRPPADETAVEIRELASRDDDPEVIVSQRLDEGSLHLEASNGYHAPVELVFGIDAMSNAMPLPPDQPLRFVLPALGAIDLFALAPSEAGLEPTIRYRYTWIAGDPLSEHRPEQPYRVPFAVAASFPVSQAFPDAITHNTPDSRYAVDISMPVGTNVYAARGGVVFEVASTHFRGSTDPADAPEANLVRILHEDGTYAVYAHLNWNTIRVRPGDVVDRGEYIADSGDTGFTSGPHLHFAVLHNRGMAIESLPVVFEGANGSEVVPRTGMKLTAY